METVLGFLGIIVTQAVSLAVVLLQTRSNHAASTAAHAANSSTLETMQSDIADLKRADMEHLAIYHRVA